MEAKNYMVIGAAVAGLALAYMAYKGAGKVVDKVTDMAGDALHAINPLNDNNVISQGSDAVYQALGGKTDPGTDLYWLLHDGGAVDKGVDLFMPNKEGSIVQTVIRAPGAAGDYLGATAYDNVQDLKKWLGEWF